MSYGFSTNVTYRPCTHDPKHGYADRGKCVEETARAVETLSGLLADGGMTVLLVEHDMEVVFSLANKITVLHRGAVIADGTPQAIKNDAEVQRAYLGGFA